MICMAIYSWLALSGTSSTDVFETLPLLLLAFLPVIWLTRQSLNGAVQLTLGHVVLFAVAFRLLALLGEPLLEDDYFRYLWDGWLGATTGNPYTDAPASWFERRVPESVEPLLDLINYPDVPTVYGPTLQALFTLSWHVAPAQLWPLQTLAITADLMLIYLLSARSHPAWLTLYAWNPLVIKETAFTVHPDVFAALFLVLALTLAWQQRTTWVQITIGVCVALAAGAKVLTLIAAPFLLQGDWRRWLGFALGVLIPIVWLGSMDPWLPAGLQAMGEVWLFNAPFHLLGLWSAGGVGFQWVKQGLLLVLLIVSIVVYWQTCGHAQWHGLRKSGLAGVIRSATLTPQFLPGVTFLSGFMFLCLPVVNPWYLIPWLALSAWQPTRTAWAASAAVLLSYLSTLHTGWLSTPDTTWADVQLYHVPAWVVGTEFVAILGALILDLRQPLAAKTQRAQEHN